MLCIHNQFKFIFIYLLARFTVITVLVSSVISLLISKQKISLLSVIVCFRYNTSGEQTPSFDENDKKFTVDFCCKALD